MFFKWQVFQLFLDMILSLTNLNSLVSKLGYLTYQEGALQNQSFFTNHPIFNRPTKIQSLSFHHFLCLLEGTMSCLLLVKVFKTSNMQYIYIIKLVSTGHACSFKSDNRLMMYKHHKKTSLQSDVDGSDTDDYKNRSDKINNCIINLMTITRFIINMIPNPEMNEIDNGPRRY